MDDKEYAKDVEWTEGDKVEARQCEYCKLYWPREFTYSRGYGYICEECKQHIED